MFQLPPALAPLARHRQFFPVKFVPDGAKDKKFPVDARTGAVSDAHDPRIWLDCNTAALMAEAMGPRHGVGFTLTDDLGMFFLDLDNCITADGQWNETAQRCMQLLAGAAVEVSHSGRGLHILGRGKAPPHSTRCAALGLEFYTGKRFVALTGRGAVGNVDTDHTPALQSLVAACFPPREEVSPAEWTAGPRADWRGPEDDEELLRRAMRSQSAGNVFGGRASFADLWTANAEVLGRAYPDPERPYDASAADAALAQHLAFWTGSDCERIERLMRRSALARPKWDREDYLRGRTIVGAVARQKDVLQDKPVEALPVPVAATGSLPKPRAVTGETILGPAQQVAHFAGCVYVVSQHRVLVPGGPPLLKPDQFKTRYGGYTFMMDARNERVSRDAFEAFTQSQALRCPQADDVVFRPDLPPLALVRDDGTVLDEGETYRGRLSVNSWWPVDVPRKVGDPQPFLDHMARILPNDRDRQILLAFAAACVQRPGEKFRWMPLIQGVEGNGKTVFSRVVAYSVGGRYARWPTPDKLGGQFNAWLADATLVCFEDIYVPNSERHVLERLKPMIAGGAKIEVERKGVDATDVECVANFIANTNHKNGLPKSANDRRIAPFFCAQQTQDDLARDGLTPAYFRNLYQWLEDGGYAIIAQWLSTYEIPEAFDPAVGTAPSTSSTQDAIEHGRGAIEEEVLECVAQGVPGFRGGWISSMALDNLLHRMGRASMVSRARRPDLLLAVGYHPHPALPEGRVNVTVLPDGGKPRLYVRRGSPAWMIKDPADVARAYSHAQENS